MEKQASDKSEKFNVLVLTICIALLAGLALWIFSSSGRSGKFEFTLFGQTVVIEFAPDAESHAVTLKRLMEEDGVKDEIKLALASHYNFYPVSPNETGLVNAIRKIPADSELAIELRSFMSEQKGLFDPELHTFRDITQASIVDEINRLGHDHETVKRLREAAYNDPRSALFPTAIAAKFIKLGQVKDNVVGVCSGSEYKGESLNVFYNDESHALAAMSLNCAQTEHEGSILVGQQEIEADFDNFFISQTTAKAIFAGNDSDLVEANVLLSRYMTQPVVPLSSIQLAEARVE